MPNDKLHPKLTVQLYTDDKCFGPGVAQLLTLVKKRGSLRAASMEISMAYSKAWTIVKNAEQQLGFPLLRSTVGGRRGGGAALTDEAERLLLDYAEYAETLKRQAEQLFAEKLGWLTE